MVITGPIFNITAPVKEYLSQFTKEDCLSNSINQKVCGIFNKYAYTDNIDRENVYTHLRKSTLVKNKLSWSANDVARSRKLRDDKNNIKKPTLRRFLFFIIIVRLNRHFF